MAIEIIEGNPGKEEGGSYNSDVVRETTEAGQIIWLKSAPTESSTSDQATISPEA